MKQKIWLGLLILAVLGVLTIAKNFDFENPEEKRTFANKMFGWAKQLSGNIVSITSYSLDKQWLPANSTKTDKDERT